MAAGDATPRGAAPPVGGLDPIDARLLRSLVARATAMLSADGAGVRFLLDDTTSVGTALPASLSVFEEVQMRAAAGPGHQARATGRPVASCDLRALPGKECFMRTLADLTDVRAVLSVPLGGETGADAGAFGVLSAYSTRPRRWSAADTEVLEALAQLAASFLMFSRAVHQQGARVDDLRQAMDTRVVAAQLAGVLSEADNAPARPAGRATSPI